MAQRAQLLETGSGSRLGHANMRAKVVSDLVRSEKMGISQVGLWSEIWSRLHSSSTWQDVPIARALIAVLPARMIDSSCALCRNTEQREQRNESRTRSVTCYTVT